MISVIVPVYKVEPYLDACVNSIVTQTYRNLEIILVDDGSPDRCPDMCEAWKEKDARIRVIHQKNGGLSAARNAGLDIARGEYIGFVDSDDMIRPDMYEALMNAICHSKKKMACCKHGWIPDLPYEPETFEIQEYNVEETIKRILTRQIGTSVWRRLYHRSVWETLRFPVGETNEDYPLLIPTTLAAGGVVEVKANLYFYRPSPNGITATYWKTGPSIFLKNLERIQEQILESRLPCRSQFRAFMIQGVFSIGINIDKHLDRLNEDVRKEQRKLLKIMRKLWLHAVFGPALEPKNKILYSMIVLRILFPVYKLSGRL